MNKVISHKQCRNAKCITTIIILIYAQKYPKLFMFALDRFLRGMCQQMDGTCPFSHKIDKEKVKLSGTTKQNASVQ